MNLYCNKLSVNINPLNSSFDYYSIKTYHSQINMLNVNAEFINLLDNLGLKITFVPVFYTRPYQITDIHSDGPQQGLDFVKLNFVYDEEDSVMVWYKSKILKTSPNFTKINTPYMRYSINEVSETHRQGLYGCSLVQVGTPHNVLVFSKPRYCISLTLRKKENNSTLTMFEALTIFKDYLVY